VSNPATPVMRWWLTPSFIIGAILSGLVIAMGLVALVWTPYDPTKLAILNRLKGPSATHWLGTDQLGRDVLSMIMAGSQNSLLVALGAVGLGATLGVLLGMLAATKQGGLLDDAIMRTSDFAFAFPAVLTAIMITAIAGPGPMNAVIAIGLFNIPVFARLARGAALQIRSLDYISAARAAGLTEWSITISHVLPNITGIIIVQVTIQFALAILAEAGLSYLGLGTQPPRPSWGRMLNEAQTYMSVQPWLAIFPGAAIASAVLAFNLLGDCLRDILDPRLRRSRQ
jgi:peptide/nickel transport system permease protein